MRLFRSVFARTFDEFVALKRACGADYTSQAQVLAKFDRYLATNGRRCVDAAVLRGFVTSVDHLSARTRSGLFGVVWQALAHARRHDGPVVELPSRPILHPAPFRPYVLTRAELDLLLLTASSVACRTDALCSGTYGTLFGLLCTTGLRISEALALDMKDVDMQNELLLVRTGKFRKARIVPVASSTIAGIREDLRRRRRLCHASTLDEPDALFISHTGRRFAKGAVSSAFQRTLDRAGIQDSTGRRPRLHDLRHTFAVRRVIAWHRAGRDVNHLLSPLSTYLGHVGIHSTQVYLRPTGELLVSAAKRFEAAYAPALRSGRKKERS